MKTLSYILALTGLLILSYCVAVAVKARIYQTGDTQSFVEHRTLETPASPRIEKERLQPTPGSPIALLSIPRLGLSATVLEGAEERQLKLGPGHIRGTTLPGEGGNFAVAGHRDTIFRPLKNIRKGDLIHVIADARERKYQVDSIQIVDPTDVSVLYPTATETLTLVTCYPFQFIGHAPKRFIVQAVCLDC